MGTMNYELLNKAKELYKSAYTPPPPEMMVGAPQGMPQQGMPPMGMAGAPMGMAGQGGAPIGMGGAPQGGAPLGGPPMDPQQVQQMIQEGLQGGKPIEEVVGILIQNGISQEAIQEALQAMQPPPPPEPEQAPKGEAPKSIEDIMNERVEEERKKRREKNFTPEERIETLENKISTLTELIQEIVDGMGQKQASYPRDILESQEIIDNSY